MKENTIEFFHEFYDLFLDKFAFLQEAFETLSNASLSDIISTLPIVFIFVFIIRCCYKIQYEKAKKKFEQENLHLKGRYFTFNEWFSAFGKNRDFSNKKYREKFKNDNFVNTDIIDYTWRESRDSIKNIKIINILILLTIIAIVILWLIIYEFELAKAIWQGFEQVSQKK